MIAECTLPHPLGRTGSGHSRRHGWGLTHCHGHLHDLGPWGLNPTGNIKVPLRGWEGDVMQAGAGSGVLETPLAASATGIPAFSSLSSNNGAKDSIQGQRSPPV